MIQLAALPSEAAAREEWERLRRRHPELAALTPRIQRLDRGEGQPPLWRLRAGGFPDREAARAACQAIRSRGHPGCLVI
ncbi:MAG: SPOR domain-containing protein [Rhodovarius sp.]|nr:SPOR domain-containing protein [Rhodovarius sp.]